MLTSRLFWNLFLGYGALIVLAVGLVGVLVNAQAEKNELQSLEDRLLNEAAIVRDLITDANGAPSRLHDAGFSLPRKMQTRVTIIAKNGDVLSDSAQDPSKLDKHNDRVEVANAFADGAGKSVRHSTSVNDELMYVALRADGPAGGEPFVVRISMPTVAIRERLSALHRLILTTVGLTTIAALAIAFLLTRRTVKPVYELIVGAEEIAAGGYGHRVSTGGMSEVAQLARTFNHMSDRLAAQFTQIDEDRQQLRTILSSMVEGVISVDGHQKVLFANDRAGKLLDFSPRAAVGRRLWELIPHEGLHEVVQAALSVASEPLQSLSLSLSLVGGKSILVHVARLPGMPSRGAVLVFHDNTELRRLETLRQEFVANVSHELKTPLAIIKACVETLIDGGVDDPNFRDQFLNRIADQSDRLNDLIIDLLRLARIESATEAFTMEEHDLAVLVRQCIERRRTLAEGRQQTLRAVPPPAEQGPALVWVDDEALEQILDNLVDNALKYTPEGGTVEVRWRRDGEHIVLAVSDTGIGIPEAELPRIFERFYRVDKARSRELGGTGLGLSIVKHLVQAMQGTLEAKSAVGKGSTFTIRFPAFETRSV
jgi:two-component system phosphate regulon sensor histidine kinase PhoR